MRTLIPWAGLSERRIRMGHGRWTQDDFRRYNARAGRSVRADGTLDTSGYRDAREMYRGRGLHADLDPRGVMRECCETEDHPNTLPVILALDVTGSMGGAAIEVAGKLSEVMREVLDLGRDVEFMIMGLGDLDYDMAPIQISQFESDIRIAEHLDKVFFEGGGGGNLWESYTAAWYMGARHTSLDCWKRGRRGLIITLGDEPLNDVLPGRRLADLTGDRLQGDVRTGALYREVLERYAVYHINVSHGHSPRFEKAAMDKWARVLDKDHLLQCRIEGIAQAIIRIILDEMEEPGARTPASAGGGWQGSADPDRVLKDREPVRKDRPQERARKEREGRFAGIFRGRKRKSS